MTTLNTGDYIGRKIDVLAWRGGKATGVVRLEQSLADQDSSGEICTGIQKLAQRFLIELLTEVGTIRYAPGRGTEFLRRVRQGFVRTEADLRAVFALAELAARTNLTAEEDDDDPPDERYRSAALAGVLIAPQQVTMTVQLKSRAEVAEFIVPLPLPL
jgi:hypothetical protein